MANRYPNYWTLVALLKSVDSDYSKIGGKWVPARPLGFASIGQRFRCAWAVFTGRADALEWPGEQ